MDEHLLHAAATLGEALKAHGLTCATAESCTGGMVGAALTAIPGSSAWFAGGVIAYANSAKQDLLGVSGEALATYGAVSHEVVRQMALGACAALNTDLAVALSGVAGPDGGSPEKPVGTVFIGLAFQGTAQSFLYRFDGDRAEVRAAAALEAVRCMIRAFDPERMPA